MIDQQHIDQLNFSLTAILEMEIILGNNVVETYYGWTAPETLFVILEKPFHKNYEQISFDVKYFELNDPHYWKAEYRDESQNQVLACRF